MNDPTSIFRREALEFRAGVRPQRSGLAMDRAWIRWLYWLLLALAVASLGLVFAVRTDETTSGPALVDPRERRFVALVPEAAASDLRRGDHVRLELGGGAGRTLSASVLSAELTNEAGAHAAGFPSSAAPAVLITGVLVGDVDVAKKAARDEDGQAVVVLRSKRLVDLFFDGVAGLFGRD
jgi:hypothetical protein